MKILMTLLTVTALITTVHAEKDHLSEEITKQCQYIVFGNGENNLLTDIYMLGIVSGIGFTINEEDASEYAKNSNKIEIKHKACQSALTNTMKYNFETIYRYEVMQLIMK